MGGSGAGPGGQGGAQPSAGGTSTAPAGADTGHGDQAGAPSTAADQSSSGGPETNNQVTLGTAFNCQPGPDGSAQDAQDVPGNCTGAFGALAIGGARTVAFTLTSLDASMPFKILGVTIQRDDTGAFTLDRGTCTDDVEVAGPSHSGEPDAAPSNTCTLRVTFAPTVEGRTHATLKIATDPGPGDEVALGGRGTPPPDSTP